MTERYCSSSSVLRCLADGRYPSCPRSIFPARCRRMWTSCCSEAINSDFVITMSGSTERKRNDAISCEQFANQCKCEGAEIRIVAGAWARDVEHCRPRCSKPAAKDRKSTRLNSSHLGISYAVFCLKKK